MHIWCYWYFSCQSWFYLVLIPAPCKTVWMFLKKLKNRSAILSINSILYPKEIKTKYQKDVCIPMFIATLFHIAKIWKQPKSQPMDEWLNKIWLYTVKYRKFFHLQWNKWISNIMLNDEGENIGRLFKGRNLQRVDK